MEAPEIVTVGHILKEMIYFPDRTLGPVLGSPAAYCSVIAAKLGAKVGIITKTGRDMPQELLIPFSEVGVDTQGIIVGEYSTVNELIYSESGDKEIRYPQKADPIFPEDIPAAYEEAKIFYVCPMDYEVKMETIQRLSALGAILSADLGGFGGAHASTHPSPEEQRNPQALKELVSHFQIMRASVEDCRHLMGDVEGDKAELAARFVEWGTDVGIITLGEEGAVVVTREATYRIPAIPGEVLDCTGAGDAFSAGFLVGYLTIGEVEQAAIFASAVALHVIEGTGGVLASRMPTREDVERRLQSIH